MSVCLASFNFIVPSQLINDYLFKFKVSSELKTYDESKEDFDEVFIFLFYLILLGLSNL